MAECPPPELMGEHMPTAFRRTLATGFTAACLTFSIAAPNAMAQQAKPDYPKITIPNPSPNIPDQYGPTGAEAYRILLPYLPQLQNWYGLSAKQLSDGFGLPRDRSIDQGEWRLANDGRIVVKEKIVPYRFSKEQDYWIWDYWNAFRLQSNPRAKIKIWINYASFDPTISNSEQEPNYTEQEKRNLTYIWQRVAEDFAPFDVNVATWRAWYNDEMVRSSPTDDSYGFAVVIDADPSNSPFIEGMAYLNS